MPQWHSDPTIFVPPVPLPQDPSTRAPFPQPAIRTSPRVDQGFFQQAFAGPSIPNAQEFGFPTDESSQSCAGFPFTPPTTTFVPWNGPYAPPPQTILVCAPNPGIVVPNRIERGARACRNCRLRKVECAQANGHLTNTNENPCERCVKENLSCVYDNSKSVNKKRSRHDTEGSAGALSQDSAAE